MISSGEDKKGKRRTENLSPAFAAELQTGDLGDARYIFPGANNTPRRAFWEPFATIGEPSLRAAAEGLAVVRPSNLRGNPGCHAFHDGAFACILEFVEKGGGSWRCPGAFPSKGVTAGQGGIKG